MRLSLFRSLINIAILVAFSFCYLSWGNDQTAFLYEVEYQLLFERSAQNFMHPLILMGLLGQLLLVYTAIVPKAKKWLSLTGVLMLGAVVALIFLVGCLSRQIPIIVSTIPFFVFVILYFKVNKRKIPAQVNP
jgi:hypothetical protein